MKTRILCFAFATGLIAALAPAMQAGDKKDKKDNPFAGLPGPGPEHKILAKCEGTWNAQVKAWFGSKEPTESKGVMKRKMIMDGRYLRESFTGSFADKKFEGLGVIGYDVDKKKYVMSWVDNFSTGVVINEGTYDPSKKTLTFVGEENTPKGKLRTKDVLTFVSETEQQFNMFRSPAPGKEFKVMEITYKRVKTEEKKEK